MTLRIALATLVLQASAMGAVAADLPPLRAAVRVLSPEAKPEPTPGTPPQPASAPRGALPQYRDQLQSQERAESAGGQDAVRFVVPLPQRPVLVEARVTIDGRPFRAVRDVRVGRLLSEITAGEKPPADESPEEKKSPPAVDNSMGARLRRYAKATGRVPSRDEVHWLLTNWGDGPIVLVLGENFERVRAGQSPLVMILDRDDDGVISAAEMATAQDRLLGLDSNRDSVVAYEEIFEAADGALRAGRKHTVAAHPVAAELSSPGDSDPDVRLAVSFNTQDAAQSKVELQVIGARSASDAPATVGGDRITIELAGALLELSAVQSANGKGSDQIAIGAINDGYPLLPEIDPNEDGKLTIRELRDVSRLLAAFDRNRDGGLSGDEILPTIRVAIGHGPTVHQHLSALRRVHQLQTLPGVQPPDWFVRMDKNQDSDLTRSEFLGTDEQFAQLDGDHDKLIDAAEAARNEGDAQRSPAQRANDGSESDPNGKRP